MRVSATSSRVKRRHQARHKDRIKGAKGRFTPASRGNVAPVRGKEARVRNV